MKVLLVSPTDLTRHGDINCSGVNKQIFGLARALSRSGDCEVHIAGSSQGSSAQALGNNVHGFFPPDDGSKKRQKLIGDQMVGLIGRESYDVVHVYDPLLSPIGRAAMDAARGRLVCTFFSPPLTDGRWLQRVLAGREPHLRAEQTVLIATSQAVAQDVRDMFRRETHVLPVGIDAQRFCAKKRQIDEAAPLRLLFVGDPSAPERGFSLLLEACKRAAQALRSTALHLEVIGGTPAAVRQVVPGLTTACLGRVTEMRMPTLYHQADLVVAPARDKRVTGSALLEAMASGAAVVASDVGPYRELCAGSGAVLFPADNEDALVSAITGLATRPAERLLRGEANAMAAEAYRWDRLLGDVRRLYGDRAPAVEAPATPPVHARQSQSHNISEAI